MKTARFLIFLLIITLLPVQIFGQAATTARISGLVTDAQGAAVTGATVKLVDKTTKAEKTTTTNEEGRYLFASLDPGLYEITIMAQGFRTTIVSEIKAEVSKATTLDLALQPGGANEQVTVTATGEVQLQREDASVGNVINEDRIKRLPNINRQATSLLLLQPSVAPSGEVSGARGDQNTFTLDGLDVSDNVGFRGALGTVVPVPTESVEEFRVTVANPNSTFGAAAGGQVNLVTKRGSNAFHGSAYEYHQNRVLNANSWTNNRLGLKRPFLIDNRFGFSVGGPVWKEHTFFFGNYEGRRLPATQQITRLVPTESLRRGVLRFRDATGNVFTVDPRTLDPRALGSNPQILSALAKFPLPNNSTVGDGLNTSGFTADFPADLRDDFGVLRLDHQINQNWSVEARGTLFRDLQNGAGQADLVNLRGGVVLSQRPKNLNVAVTGTLRPNLVNEVRVGHAFDNFILDVISPTTIAGFNFPVNLGGALLDDLIDVDTQRARKQTLSSGTTQFIDNATWSKGDHTIQFGGNLRRITTFHFRDDKVIGSLTTPVAQIGTGNGGVQIPAAQRPPTCSATVTQNCLGAGDVSRYNNLFATLLGIVESNSYLAVRDASLQPLPVGSGLVNDSVLRAWEFYATDIWRMKPSLTLTYGLQYQWHTPPIDKQGRQVVLAYKDGGKLVDAKDYLRQKRAAAEQGDIFNPDIAYLPVKDAGRDGVFDIDRNDFSPRVAIAWQPSYKNGILGHLFGERRTVIRGGYLLLYDRLNTVSSAVLPLLGVGFAQTLTSGGFKNAAGLPFRVGVDGAIPAPPVNTAVKPPVVPAKAFGPALNFGELISLTLDPNIRTPYNHTIDFSIQRELPGRMLLEVGYIGRFGRNLFQDTNLSSVPFFFKDKQSGQVFAQAFDNVATQLRNGVAGTAVTPQPWFENQFAAFGGTRFLASNLASFFVDGDLGILWNVVLNGFRDLAGSAPYDNRQVPDLFIRQSVGRSNYNALFVTLHKRTSHGLTFDFNYTLSKSLDQIGLIQNNVAELSNSYFPDIDYSPSFFDRRHVLNSNFVYDLPVGRDRRFHSGNWIDNLIGGWYVSGIFQASSGTPLTVFQGLGVAGFGGGVLFPFPTGAIPLKKPDFGNGVHSGVAGSGNTGISGNPATGGTGLNLFANPEQVANSFRQVLLSQDGRSGNSQLYGLGRWQFDMSLGKQTKITERVKFGLTFDFFNLFNHVNFLNPALTLGNRANFGVINGQLINATFRPRTIQVGGRVEF